MLKIVSYEQKQLKILLTRKLHDFAIKELRKRYDVETHTGKIPMPRELLVSKIRDKEGLICYPYDTIDSDVIQAGRKLPLADSVASRNRPALSKQKLREGQPRQN